MDTQVKLSRVFVSGKFFNLVYYLWDMNHVKKILDVQNKNNFATEEFLVTYSKQ